MGPSGARSPARCPLPGWRRGPRRGVSHSRTSAASRRGRLLGGLGPGQGGGGSWGCVAAGPPDSDRGPRGPLSRRRPPPLPPGAVSAGAAEAERAGRGLDPGGPLGPRPPEARRRRFPRAPRAGRCVRGPQHVSRPPRAGPAWRPTKGSVGARHRLGARKGLPSGVGRCSLPVTHAVSLRSSGLFGRMHFFSQSQISAN